MTEPWQTFFGEAYLRFSVHVLTPERTQREVTGIRSLLNLPEGAKILDLGCGPGRITIPLAQAGYHMVAVDASTALLDHARAAAEQAGVDVRFVHGDIRELPFAEEFDAVINTGTAFGYLSREEEDRRAMQQIARVLKPGGLFLIDTENREKTIKQVTPRFWARMGPTTILAERAFDPISSRWREVLRWEEAGAEREAVLDLRLYTARELINLMAEAGLGYTAAAGGLDGSPYAVDSQRMVLMASRICR